MKIAGSAFRSLIARISGGNSAAIPELTASATIADLPGEQKKGLDQDVRLITTYLNMPLLTGPGGKLELPRDLQLKTAIFADGTWLVHTRYTNSQEIICLQHEAKTRLRLPLQQPTPTDGRILQQLADHHADTTITADVSSALRAKLTDYLDRAVAEHANDIEFNRIGDVCTVRLQVHGFLTDPIDELHGTDAHGIFTSLFHLRDNGDGVELPSKDQKISVTEADKLPTDVLGTRVQFYPTATGRAAQLRVNYLTNRFAPKGLASLDITNTQRRQLLYLQGISAGLISFSGPMESGKSATFNIWLSDLIDAYHGAIKVFAADDPPEGIDPRIMNYDVRSIDSSTDDPFYDALQIAMRVSPHFIKVQEFRTKASAELGFYAANIGKPVGGSVHCDSIMDICDRYEEIGVPRRLAYHPTRHTAWAGQRLIPTLCPDCSEPLPLSAENNERHQGVFDLFAEALSTDIAATLKVRGRGCPRCKPKGSIKPAGIIGRQLALELFLPDPSFIRLLDAQGSVVAREEWIANRKGLSLPLRAWFFLKNGTIGVDEYTKFVSQPSTLHQDLEYSNGRYTDE